MAKTAIFIRGGVFQGALSDTIGNQIVVIDYDDEAEGDHDRGFQPIQVERNLDLYAQRGSAHPTKIAGGLE